MAKQRYQASADEQVLSKLFGESSLLYLKLFDEIAPLLTEHRYHIWGAEEYKRWIESENFSLTRDSRSHALELLDKAHVAATAALFRTKQWIQATCIGYENYNLFAWAAGAKGLVESTGDILDGLLDVSLSLAMNHAVIESALAGRVSTRLYGFWQIQQLLDRAVFAEWMRPSGSGVRKSDRDRDYLRALDRPIPGIRNLYRELCGITYPSNASVNYLYEMELYGLTLNLNKDLREIEILRDEFDFGNLLYYAFSPPLLILKVLEHFGHHPPLRALQKLDWNQIPVWAEIQRHLNRG